MGRLIARLTLDFDAMSGFVARARAMPAPVTRRKFGAGVGTPRLLARPAARGIPATGPSRGHVLDSAAHLRHPVVIGRGHRMLARERLVAASKRHYALPQRIEDALAGYRTRRAAAPA